MMSMQDNPYASALDGLELADPVAAFFDFCRERERIRLKREAGHPGPWTSDPVFQRGRFLNVFREDDRVTKSILAFLRGTESSLPTLVRRALFARWCNRDTTLSQTDPALLDTPAALKAHLQTLPHPPWCNVTAYPVSPVRVDGRLYSRLDTACSLFAILEEQLTEAVQAAEGDIVTATENINALLGMDNDFPIFMAVVDMAWIRPDVIDPESPVPTGIGAVAYLDRLQAHLGLADHHATCDRMMALQTQYWPEARRPFQPIDVEYLACECRKYYSYVNGTKAFEGKNRFIPGRAPRLLFDIPEADATPVQTEVHVIAGGPCSGKTTLIEALASSGVTVQRETAELCLEAGVASGQDAQWLRADPVAWQQMLLQQDVEMFRGLPVDAPLCVDTSCIETLVYSRRAGLEEGERLAAWLHAFRYRTIFFLEPLAQYERTDVRLEDAATAGALSAEIAACYGEFGYGLVRVPPLPVAERLAFIRAHLPV